MSSGSNQTPGPPASTPTSNFTAIFNASSIEYQKVTGQRLDTHPFSTQLGTCDSAKDVSELLRTQAQAFDSFRKGDERLMACLDPIVHILFTFSATLGEGIGLPFSPAKTIFTGIGVLLGAARDVAASHDAIMHLFERIHLFLQRLDRYTEIPLTDDLTELLGKIMAQLLFIFALSTKAMMNGRIKKVLKRLVGRKEVEEAVLRLDTLTKEENVMIVARNLEITHRVDGNVEASKVLTENIDNNVKATISLTEDIDGNVKATKALTEDIGDNVNAIKALTEDVSDNVKVTKTLAEDIGDDVKATRDVTDNVQRIQLQDKLRTWLSPPSPSINHNTACEIKHNGTATWFIQGNTFREWKESGSLLWICGNPGAGKSILCSAIIQDIQNKIQASSALLAYYYFDYKDSSKRDLRGLLASLVFQLGGDSVRCWSVLYQLYTKCRNGSDQPSNAALAECLRNMLKLPRQLPIFIILDALDECPNTVETPSAREKVLDFLGDLVGSEHPNLFICITSRPEQDIQSVFNPLTLPLRRVSIHEEVGQTEDINKYLRSFVQTDRAMRRWKDEDKELVINTLSERANGMFRWVFCQLDTLRRCMPSSIRKALDELPTTLDDTYERALQGVPKEKRWHAHRLFQCLVAAVRPLRAEELGEIFAIDFEQDVVCNVMVGWRPDNPEEAVLSTCSTLITVIEDKGSRTIQFCHFSVKEFLTSDRLRTSEVGSIRDYHIRLDSAHTLFARACLAVLLESDVDHRVETFPLALYAAQNWVKHAKYEDVASRVQGLMEDLFNPKKPYLAAWISLHDVAQDWVREFYLTAESTDSSPPEAAALFYAALCGFSGVVEYLIITHTKDINAQYRNIGAPLHVASAFGHAEVVCLLLQHNANVNARCAGYFGWMSLHFASWKGYTKLVQLLLDHSAEINARSTINNTPLCVASHLGHLDIVRLLLRHEADLHIRGSQGWSPLQFATKMQHVEVVQLLLEHGAVKD